MKKGEKAVSVVIPTLNAQNYLKPLLESLLSQDHSPEEVIFVDSLSNDSTLEIAASFPRTRVIPIERFSHGKARNMGAQAAKGEFVVFLTQDALPTDGQWMTTLLQPFEEPVVAATYSRQIPRSGASPMEQFFLAERFPATGSFRSKKPGQNHLSLEDVFFSNVSAAFRRKLLLEFPFDEELIMSEDQQISRDFMEAGYAVVYNPDSVVIHSHDYSLLEVFRRYFDSVHSLTVIFPGHGVGTSANMGLLYLKKEFLFILKNYPSWLPYYLFYTVAKTLGTFAGHFAHFIPKSLIRKMSLHSYHWE